MRRIIFNLYLKLQFDLYHFDFTKKKDSSDRLNIALIPAPLIA